MDEQAESRFRALEDQVAEIQRRNQRVELDKLWERSVTRRAWLLLLTYLLTSLVFWLIGVERFLANAFIPTIGFLLSTLSLPVARRIWEKRRRG